MKTINPNQIDLKSFDLDKVPGDNKADSIIAFYRYGVPFDIQEYIKENFQAQKGDLHAFCKNAYADEKLKKTDPRFEKFKLYYGKVQREKPNYNFSNAEIKLILENGPYKKPMQIAKMIFVEETDEGDEQFLKGKAKPIRELLDSFGILYDGPSGEFMTERPTDADYKLPETEEGLLRKVIANVPGCQWKKSSLDAHQRKCLRFMAANLMSLHFLRSINSLRDAGLRELFEQEFIKHIYDKPDLIPEDVNQYIALASMYVDKFKVEEKINIFDRDFKNSAQGDDSNGGSAEDRSRIVADLEKLSKQRALIITQINQTSKALTGVREERLARETERSQSVGKIINDCADEKKRELLVMAAKARTEKLREHIKEVEGYDETTKGEINGISIEEILGYTQSIL